jgi:glycosidase
MRTSVDLDIGPHGKFVYHDWKLRDMKKVVDKWQTLMHGNNGWSALFSENHDQPRTVSRFASDLPQHRNFAAKLLATWLACQSGTLFVYQGQELGMRNVPEKWGIEEYKDIETQNHWNKSVPTPFGVNFYFFF